MGLTWKLKMSVRPSLAKELLDLPYIVNKVDELGGEDLQLNWQEIATAGFPENKACVHAPIEF